MVEQMNDKPDTSKTGSMAGSQDETAASGNARAQPARKSLTPAAQRALAEAEERRRKADEDNQRAKELGGRRGPDPVRYGDWENDGIASDF
jgi:hypothetical protein